GSLNPHKGVHVLLDAFMRTSDASTSLRIYGKGVTRSYVDSLRNTAAKDSRIVFCGEYCESELSSVLENVDVIVMPSMWFENHPLILHEAFASGVPVIASNIGVMAEKVKNDMNGFVFEMGNSKHLSEVLRRI